MDSRQGRSGGTPRQGQHGWSERSRARRTRFSAQVEGLESRQLLTGYINTVSEVGSDTAAPGAVTVGATAAAPDGSLWFVQGASTLTNLGINAAKSSVNLPATSSAGPVVGLTTDAKGNVWYARGNVVGRASKGGTATEFALPNAGDTATSIALGPDGAVWVGVAGAKGPALARVDAQGAITEVPLQGVGRVKWLTAGGDGNLWFVDGDGIARATTAGAVTRFAMPAPQDGSAVDLSNAQLTKGDASTLWFLGLGGVSKITTAGVVTTYQAPGAALNSLAYGADGNIWFSFLANNMTGNSLSTVPGGVVARMTPDGSTTIVPDRAGSQNVPVYSLTATQDDNVWLDEGGNTLGRMSLKSLPSVSIPIIRPTTKGFVTSDAQGYVSGTIASFVANTGDPSSSTYSASIDWGDGTSGTAQVQLEGDGKTYDVIASHTFKLPANSQQNVTISVTDGNGSVAKIFNTMIIKVDPTAGAAGQTGTASTLPPALTTTPAEKAVQRELDRLGKLTTAGTPLTAAGSPAPASGPATTGGTATTLQGRVAARTQKLQAQLANQKAASAVLSGMWTTWLAARQGRLTQHPAAVKHPAGPRAQVLKAPKALHAHTKPKHG